MLDTLSESEETIPRIDILFLSLSVLELEEMI